MNRVVTLIALAVLTNPAWSQPAAPDSAEPGAGPTIPAFTTVLTSDQWRRPLESNRNFPDFIGFMTNPLDAIDPRSLTQFWPMFGSSWLEPTGTLPGGNAQAYGAGLNVAVTERFSVGFNQGGYAVMNFNPLPASALTPALVKRINDFRGTHAGWLNLGGFAQYTLIEDVERQFLFTTGLRLEIPTGESSVFQGHGQPYMAPYITAGKGFGNFHVLTTAGYKFPLGDGRDIIDTFYGNLHFDYKMRWFYPLLEFNWAAFTSSLKSDLPLDRGLFGFGSVDATGSILTISPGFNTVLIQDRLEFGAAYTTRLASDRNVNLNGFIVKMIMRY